MKTFYRASLLAIAALAPLASGAQTVLSTYYMESAPVRMNMNPAMAPNRGYITLPVIGSFGVSLSSNVFGQKFFSELIHDDRYSDYFLSNSFYKHLEERNYADIDVDFSIISAGWWAKSGFWSIDLSSHTTIENRIPRSLYDFMRDMHGVNDLDWRQPLSYAIDDQDVRIRSYFEVGVGFASHPIADHLTIGGKIKGLLGAANVHANLQRLYVDYNIQGVDDADLDWSNLTYQQMASMKGTVDIDVDIQLDGYMKGLQTPEDGGKFSEVSLEAPFGLAGAGAALDLGLKLKFSDLISASAAITDVGFLKWNEDQRKFCEAKGSVNYLLPRDVNQVAELVGSGSTFNTDIYDLVKCYNGVSPDDRIEQTWLTSHVVAGVEFNFLDDKLSVGALGRAVVSNHSNGELSFSGVFTPVSLIELGLSYNIIQSRAQSFGMAVRLGPLFISTDYMFLNNNSRVFNAFLGLAVPLGKEN